jgi:hypothetical protein
MLLGAPDTAPGGDPQRADPGLVDDVAALHTGLAGEAYRHLATRDEEADQSTAAHADTAPRTTMYFTGVTPADHTRLAAQIVALGRAAIGVFGPPAGGGLNECLLPGARK